MEHTLDTKYKRNQLLRVEIKSEALVKEGKKGFITYFKGGSDKMIIHDLKQLYPQFMADEFKPNVDITPITRKQYNMDVNTKRVNVKGQMVKGRANIMKLEDYGLWNYGKLKHNL